MEAWVKPKVETFAHWVQTLGKIAKRHSLSEYSGLGTSLQLERKYLQSTVPIVGNLLGPIKEAWR